MFYAQYLGTSRVKGGKLLARCPFHAEKTASFSVTLKDGRYRGRYFCYGCGAKGDMFEFISKLFACGFIDAVKEVARQSGIEIQVNKADPEAKKIARLREARELWMMLMRAELEKNTTAVTREFGSTFRAIQDVGLATRASINGLNWDDAEELNADAFHLRLVFAVRDPFGHIVGFSGRAPKRSGAGEASKWYHSPGLEKSSHLYNYPVALRDKESKEVIVSEGFKDTYAEMKRGYLGVATMGASVSAHQATLLAHLKKKVVLAFDDDAAGRKGAMKAIPILVSRGVDVSVVDWGDQPSGEDPYSYLARNETLPPHIPWAQAVVKNAVSLHPENNSMQWREIAEVASALKWADVDALATAASVLIPADTASGKTPYAEAMDMIAKPAKQKRSAVGIPPRYEGEERVLLWGSMMMGGETANECLLALRDRHKWGESKLSGVALAAAQSDALASAEWLGDVDENIVRSVLAKEEVATIVDWKADAIAELRGV